MLGDVGPSRKACHILQIVGNQSGIVARGIVMSCLSLQQLVSPAPAPASDVTWHYGGQGTSWQQILFNGKRLTEYSHFIVTWNICTDLLCLKRSLNPSVLLITVHYSCERVVTIVSNHIHNEQINLWNPTSNVWMLNERMRTYEFFSFSSLSSLNRRPILSKAWLSEALTLRISVWLPSDVSVLKNERKLDQSNIVRIVTKLYAQIRMTGFHR